MNSKTYLVLSAALAFHMAYDLANADGKIDISDIQFLIAPMIRLPAAIAGASGVLEEMKSMPAAERGEILTKLAAEYDIADDVLEAKIEAGVEWLLATGKLTGALIA